MQIISKKAPTIVDNNIWPKIYSHGYPHMEPILTWYSHMAPPMVVHYSHMKLSYSHMDSHGFCPCEDKQITYNIAYATRSAHSICNAQRAVHTQCAARSAYAMRSAHYICNAQRAVHMQCAARIAYAMRSAKQRIKCYF